MMEFLKSSLHGLDDIVLYERSNYWEEFNAIMSFPTLHDLPGIPLQDDLIQKMHRTGALHILDPKSSTAPLDTFKLPWHDCKAVAIIPLFDRDKSDPLQGFLCLASRKDAALFSAEMRLLLTSVAFPLSEALSRRGRQTDHLAQARLQKSKSSFNQ
jgi:hypothetical protein